MTRSAHSGEIRIPDVAAQDADSIELLRVWLTAGAPQVSLRAETHPDPAAWGAILGDIARQLGRAYAEDRGLVAGSVTALIRASFDQSFGTVR